MPFDQPHTRRFYVGLDLGQRRDYTALTVIEKLFKPFWGDEWLYAGKNEKGTTRLMVRVIERMRLATPYPEIVEWVKAIVTHPDLHKRCTLTVDATGVGAPVVDMLRRANMGCNLVPITIVGSGGGSARYNPITGSVPRAELLTNLQLMIQQDQLEIAQSCIQSAALQQELKHLKLDGTLYGQHDDISIALALSAWSCTKGH
jgi:hypothetical protein